MYFNWLKFGRGSNGVKNLAIITQATEKFPEMDLVLLFISKNRWGIKFRSDNEVMTAVEEVFRDQYAKIL